MTDVIKNTIGRKIRLFNVTRIQIAANRILLFYVKKNYYFVVKILKIQNENDRNVLFFFVLRNYICSAPNLESKYTDRAYYYYWTKNVEFIVHVFQKQLNYQSSFQNV